MHGASGSGKSWLSERLVPRLPAVRIRSDLERKRLAGLDPFVIGIADERIYTLQFNERTYAHLLESARGCLRAGVSTIVDAAFLKHHERRAFARLAREQNARFLIVSCHAERGALAARIAQRRAAGNDPSDADERVMERQLETMEPIAPDERDQTLFVNTQEPQALNKVLQRCGTIG
jgi:predicted kinase